MDQDQYKKTNRQARLDRILNAKPGKTTAFIYLAIVLSLVAHVLVLSMIYLFKDKGLSSKEAPEESITEIPLEFEEPEIIEEDQLPSQMSEDVRNLVANAASPKTRERVNYRSRSSKMIEQEVMDELKELEAAEYQKLKEGHSVPEPKQKSEQKPKVDEDREDYEWVGKTPDASYEGSVRTLWDLPGRSAISTPKPVYRCRASGTVVVNIEVDPEGRVVMATVDETRSEMNECLRSESEQYVARWKFNYKADAPKRQKGRVTFIFSAQ